MKSCRIGLGMRLQYWTCHLPIFFHILRLKSPLLEKYLRKPTIHIWLKTCECGRPPFTRVSNHGVELQLDDNNLKMILLIGFPVEQNSSDHQTVTTQARSTYVYYPFFLMPLTHSHIYQLFP